MQKYEQVWKKVNFEIWNYGLPLRHNFWKSDFAAKYHICCAFWSFVHSIITLLSYAFHFFFCISLKVHYTMFSKWNVQPWVFFPPLKVLVSSFSKTDPECLCSVWIWYGFTSSSVSPKLEHISIVRWEKHRLLVVIMHKHNMTTIRHVFRKVL